MESPLPIIFLRLVPFPSTALITSTSPAIPVPPLDIYFRNSLFLISLYGHNEILTNVQNEVLIFCIYYIKNYIASKVTIPCSRIILFLTFVYSSSFNNPNAYILPRTASFFANFKASKIFSCLSFLLFQATDHQIRYKQMLNTLQCGCLFSL